MTRDEHLAWAKRRALEYVDAGQLDNAIASMISDLGKHPETKIPAELAFLGLLQDTPYRVRHWIEGFR